MANSISILPGKKDVPPSVFAPGATTRPRKNRVVGSEVFSYDRTRTTWSQPVEPHREITLTITIIVSGRHSFWSMDSFEGWIYDPIALHKYLYAGSNPVSYKDPCGNFTLTELQSSMLIGAIVNSISTVATPGFLQKPLSEQLLDIGISASIGAASGAAGVGIAKSYFAVTKPMWKAMAAGGTASFVNQLATEVFNFIIKDEKLTIGLVCGASIRTFQATFAGVVTGGLMVKIMTPSPGSSRFFPGGYEAPIPLGWFEVPASSVVGGIAKGSSGGVLTNLILNWMALDRRWCK